MIKNILKNQQGQGLIELIIAIAVITVGLFAVWTLFLANFNGEQEAKARVVGANLAREGIEAVKNIRDSNWLHNDENQYDENHNLWNWDHNLAPGSYVVENLFSTSTDYDGMADLSLASAGNTKLYINSSTGFFSYDSSGKFSGYSRLITIQNICCNVDTSDPSQTTEHIIKEECSGQGVVLSDGDCLGTQAKIGVDVVSRVDWTLKNKPRKIIIEDQLFDWR